MIYFIRMIETNFVKIGFTGDNDIGRRLSTLQTNCPRKLQVLAISDGDESVESFYHNQYSAYKTDGGQEWFNLPDGILAEIKDLSDPEGANQRTIITTLIYSIGILLVSFFIILAGLIIWLSSTGYALIGIVGFVVFFFLILFIPITWWLQMAQTDRVSGIIKRIGEFWKAISGILQLPVRHNNLWVMGRRGGGWVIITGRYVQKGRGV